jgi:hypothetical protein
MNVPISCTARHCRTRQEQRAITDDAIEFALIYGRRYSIVGDKEAICVDKEDIPADVPARYARKYQGTVVIVSKSGMIVTTYRNPDYSRRLSQSAC